MPLVYCQREYTFFYIDSIADNNQKMKGKKEYERKNGRGKEVQNKL